MAITDGKNYQKLFWRFWIPHPWDKEKHNFKLYYRKKDRFYAIF